MRIEAILFQIYINILREIIENNFAFPQNLGVQRRPFFVLGASQDALLAKSLPRGGRMGTAGID